MIQVTSDCREQVGQQC